MASLAAVITNIAISLYGKPGTSSVQVSEYMPVWDQEELREPKKQSVEEMKNALISWAEQQNKRVKNK